MDQTSIFHVFECIFLMSLVFFSKACTYSCPTTIPQKENFIQYLITHHPYNYVYSSISQDIPTFLFIDGRFDITLNSKSIFILIHIVS